MRRRAIPGPLSRHGHSLQTDAQFQEELCYRNQQRPSVESNGDRAAALRGAVSRRTFKFFVFLSCYYAVTGWLMRWYFDCSSAAEAQSCRDAVDLQHKCICCTMALLVAVGTIAVDHASKPTNAPLPLTAKSPQRGPMRSPRTHRCY